MCYARTVPLPRPQGCTQSLCLSVAAFPVSNLVAYLLQHANNQHVTTETRTSSLPDSQETVCVCPMGTCDALTGADTGADTVPTALRIFVL